MSLKIREREKGGRWGGKEREAYLSNCRRSREVRGMGVDGWDGRYKALASPLRDFTKAQNGEVLWTSPNASV